MPNSYFQFKQFRIEQGQCAMKVTTEGCILGAWVAKQAGDVKRVLDIGAGTGLISLMLAQKLASAEIHAVELNEDAAAQALDNFEKSPWKERVFLHYGSIQTYQAIQKFDLIISNPPFFNQSLSSPSSKINLARHDDSLSQQELVASILTNLTADGLAYILYPERESDAFQQIAEQAGLHVHYQLTVLNSPGAGIFRKVMAYGLKPAKPSSSVLIIKDENQQYTSDFVDLLRTYYLHL